MKRIKKYASLLLALVMALALAVPAMAAENDKVTVSIPDDLNGHTFAAYQIFKAETQQGANVEETDQKIALGNVTWGDGISHPAFGLALKNHDNAAIKAAFKDVDADDAQAVANAIGTFKTDSAEAKIIANVADQNKIGSGTPLQKGDTDLPIGYYLIVDTTEGFDPDATDTFYNASLLQLTTSINIRVKGEAPSVDKKVLDVNDTEGGAGTWEDSADHDVGDQVKFQLTATLPSNFTDYESYVLVFHDTLSGGLTYDNNAVVTLGDGGGAPVIAADVKHENGELTITIADVTKVEGATNGSKIVVNYSATLNEGAKFVENNEVRLEYSNNPNDGGEGDRGTTPPKTVFVFTYTPIVNKVNKDNEPLAGAQFTLYKNVNNEWKEVMVLDPTNAEGTSFKADGVDDGWYKLVETKTPDGYNTAADIYFKVRATHTDKGEDGKPAVTSFEIIITDEKGDAVEVTENTPSFNINAVPTNGNFDTNIVNNRGVELPETGGIGTTIFYVLGGLLTLGAVVLLVTKKRMSLEDK